MEVEVVIHLVKDGVHLGVTDVHVLCLGPVGLIFAPGKGIITTSGGETIITNP